MNKEIIELIFSDVDKTIKDYELLYPSRSLDASQMVTRYAPSPTGFVHVGALFATYINSKLARQTKGVFYLRIEDTDKKREVADGVNLIIKDLNNFGITFDEGILSDGEAGNYGPYIQSKRRLIYRTFAKHLLETGLAYPCFCTEDALTKLRARQEQIKDRIGYYGHYATCRELTEDEVITKLKNKEQFVLRLKSPGNYDNKVSFTDDIKGHVEFPENDLDIVLLKADGIPTYHLAHIVDDYLMKTTHVVRGDEWLSSLPIHLQLFDVFKLPRPRYGHIAPLVKKDGESRRKLSKRKDPEAAVSYYHEHGIPNEALMIYLITVANSNFEAWMDQNPEKSIDDFTLTFEKMSGSGSVFDMDKVLNISKNYLASLTAEEVYNKTLAHALEYDLEFAKILENNQDHATRVFNIERGQKNNRKDISVFSDMKREFWYMFDELFISPTYDWKLTDAQERKAILSDYITNFYNPSDDSEAWFNKLKDLAEAHGYAREVKIYKQNPEAYKGHVGDMGSLLRVAMTSQGTSPDLYSVINCFTKEQVELRIEKAINS